MAKKKRRKARGNGEGSIYPLKNGRWAATITLGYDPNGKRVRKTKTARTRADAAAFLLQLQQEANGWESRDSSGQTVRDFLLFWLDDHVRTNRKKSTHADYKRYIDHQLTEHVGHIQLEGLKPDHVIRMLSKMDKREDSPYTRKKTLVTLRAAMEKAVEWGKIHSNPCSGVESPEFESEETDPFSLEESRRILQLAEPHRLYALFLLAFSTGMRPGELFGLEWQDIDFDEQQLSIVRTVTCVNGKLVHGTPKTKAGKRTLDLSDAVVAALNERRAIALKEGQASLSHVFPTARGKYIRRTNFARRQWKPLLEKLEIRERGFYHVRHTYATLSLGADPPVPVHVVSKILGHRDVSTTLNIYAHAIPEQKAKAVETSAKLFG